MGRAQEIRLDSILLSDSVRVDSTNRVIVFFRRNVKQKRKQ